MTLLFTLIDVADMNPDGSGWNRCNGIRYGNGRVRVSRGIQNNKIRLIPGFLDHRNQLTFNVGLRVGNGQPRKVVLQVNKKGIKRSIAVYVYLAFSKQIEIGAVDDVYRCHRGQVTSDL